MDIKSEKQYNQSMGKYKILSTASGVGSIVTTKWGGFIMPLSSNNWALVDVITQELKDSPNIDLQRLQDKNGVELIEDDRFVSFLTHKKGFTNLRCFAAVPHINLDSFNQISEQKIKEHPLNGPFSTLNHENIPDNRLYIPAIIFPRWFISTKNSELKTFTEWKNIWQERRCNDGNLKFFTPPRDPNKKTRGKIKYRNLTDDSEYALLEQVPLVLICENGHISDIPWYKFFCASLNHVNLKDENGFDLFHYDCPDCEKGGMHNLKWLTSRNQSESWGILKCSKCGKTVPLTGIMNIKPFCRGEKPWTDDHQLDSCIKNGKRTKMQVAMLTSNSIYYAVGFSSLYIPSSLIPAEDRILSDAAEHIRNNIEKKYKNKKLKDPNYTKEAFWERNYSDIDDFISNVEIDYSLTISTDDYYCIKNCFLGLCDKDKDIDPATSYRFVEYKIFADKDNPDIKSEYLDFKSIIMPESLEPYFSTIKQVKTLSLISTQLGFGRVNMPTSKLVDGQIVPPGDEMKPIYNGVPEDVRVLPANRSFGEGLFFAFDQDAVNKWVNENNLELHYNCQVDNGSMGDFLYSEMSLYGKARFFLLHTFSHLIMKELEFSCGYPTASLNERLYYSDKMCGVLIYTADGAEGSMGGLVWQGQTRLINKIIHSALQRALSCSSDPLCWENKDGLNRASCFSCTMVSETSCEHFNLGLDRRALVDEKFGYFKDLIL